MRIKSQKRIEKIISVPAVTLALFILSLPSTSSVYSQEQEIHLQEIERQEHQEFVWGLQEFLKTQEEIKLATREGAYITADSVFEIRHLIPNIPFSFSIVNTTEKEMTLEWITAHSPFKTIHQGAPYQELKPAGREFQELSTLQGRVRTLQQEVMKAQRVTTQAKATLSQIRIQQAKLMEKIGEKSVTFRTDLDLTRDLREVGDKTTVTVKAVITGGGRFLTVERDFTFTLNPPLPSPDGWARGDFHIHTVFSDAGVRVGPDGPRYSIKQAAEAARGAKGRGMQAIIITDHDDNIAWRDTQYGYKEEDGKRVSPSSFEGNITPNMRKEVSLRLPDLPPHGTGWVGLSPFASVVYELQSPKYEEYKKKGLKFVPHSFILEIVYEAGPKGDGANVEVYDRLTSRWDVPGTLRPDTGETWWRDEIGSKYMTSEGHVKVKITTGEHDMTFIRYVEIERRKPQETKVIGHPGLNKGTWAGYGRDIRRAAKEVGITVLPGVEFGRDEGHLLAYGLGSFQEISTRVCKEHGKYPCDSCGWSAGQNTINHVNNNLRGFGYIAHPFVPDIEPIKPIWDWIDWDDWTVTGFTGLEVWNAKVGRWAPWDIRNAADKWDELLQNPLQVDGVDQKVFGIGNSDAHTLESIGAVFNFTRRRENCLDPNCERGECEECIMAALKTGQVVFGKGPFLNFTIDPDIKKEGDEVGVVGGTVLLPSVTGPINLKYELINYKEMLNLIRVIRYGRLGEIPITTSTWFSPNDHPNHYTLLNPQNISTSAIRLEGWNIVPGGGGVVVFTNPIWIEFAPTIGHTPTSFNFTATVGTNPPTQTLRISNPAGGTLNWSVSDDAAVPTDWLSLTPTSGSSTGETDNVRVSVDITGLTPGIYGATITISATEATNTPQRIPVSLRVGSFINYSPSSFSFTAIESGRNPDTQTLWISGAGGGAWRISDDVTWLTLSPTRGFLSEVANRVTVAVDITGLDAGTYNTTFTILNDVGETWTVPVSLTIEEPFPIIGCAPIGFGFVGVAKAFRDEHGNLIYTGWINPPNRQTLRIFNTGGRTLNWSLSKPAAWLTLSRTSGSSTGETDTDDVNLMVDITGLSHGTYSTNVTISAPDAAPRTVGVRVVVLLNVALPPPPSVIGHTPPSFSFIATEPGVNPATQTLRIFNAGEGTSLNWSVSTDANWLTLSPVSGSSTGEWDSVTVGVDTVGLAGGTYNATITISAPGANNAPQTIPVSLNVPATIGYTALQFRFTAAPGETSSGTLGIFNTRGGTLNWSVSTNATWLSLNPASGSSTGETDNVTILVNASGLAEGTYSATITIEDPDATNTPQIVPVNLTVAPPVVVGERRWTRVVADGFGDWGTWEVSSLTAFGNYLYAGTYRRWGAGAEIWRSPDGTVWEQVVADGFGDVNNRGIFSLAVFGNYLYAGTCTLIRNGEYTGRSAEIWRSPDGTPGSWTRVSHDGLGDASNWKISSFAVFGNFLYAGTYNQNTGAQVWRSPDGLRWERVSPYGFGDANNREIPSLAVFGNYLFAGTRSKVTGAAELWRWDGITWELAIRTKETQAGWARRAFSLAVFGNYLFAGTRYCSHGIRYEAWRTLDGTTWEYLDLTYSGTVSVVFGNHRYVGSDDWYYDKIVRSTDGFLWGHVSPYGFGDANNQGTSALAVFGNYLYAGTHNRKGAQIWRVGPEPTIRFLPTSFSFTATEGGTNFQFDFPWMDRDYLWISNDGGGTLDWSVSADATWLSLSPTSGSFIGGEIDRVTIVGNITGLTASTYSATITISAPGATNTPQTIPVSLTVHPPATIGYTPSSFSFTATEGGAEFIYQMLSISNTGRGRLDWTASTDADWLTVWQHIIPFGTPAGETDDVPVFVNMIDLTSGTYSATITISAPGATNTPQTIPVSLTVRPPATIGYTPSSFSFTATEGGANFHAFLSISNVGESPLDWTVSEDADWLALAPISGSFPREAGVAVAVDIAGLTSGSYSATITINAPGATNTPQTIPVNLTIAPLPVTIGYTPPSLSFTATPGGANPPTQALGIFNIGGGTLNWSVSTDAVWLSLTPTSGSSTGEADNVTVAVDIAGLTSGTHSATITISALGATNTPLTVPVSLIIGPFISYYPPNFSFTAAHGGANPLAQTLDVLNIGEGTLHWTVSEDATWLTLAPTSGSSTGEIDRVTVAVDIAGLPSGTYSATITIDAPDATNTPQTIPVSLIIGPFISYYPPSISFTAAEGAANPPTQALGIFNIGGGTLDWTVSEDAAWLSLSPISGFSTGETDNVTVAVDITGLPSGSYNATITISAPGATNTPQTIPVSLVIDPFIGAWRQVNDDGFGDANNEWIFPLVEFRGYLYTGTWNETTGSEVWRSPDGITWTQVNHDGFGDVNNRGIFSLAVFGNYLYTGTLNMDFKAQTSTGGEVWRSPDGNTWTQVATGGFGDANNLAIVSLVGFDGYLYAGTLNMDFKAQTSTGGEVWRSPDGTTWTQVATGGFGDANNTAIFSLVEFDGSLYAGTWNEITGAQVWRSPDGIIWTQVNHDGFGDDNNQRISSLAVFGNYLFAGTGNRNTGGEVWRWDSITWTQVNHDGFGDANNLAIVSLVEFDGSLYAGTWNEITGAEVWRWDGIIWTQVNHDGFGDANNRGIFSLAVFGNYLFAGTGNWNTGGEVWRAGPESIIGFGPTSFSFTATEGGANPPTQALGIFNAGGDTLNWSVSTNVAWLSLTPTSGSSTGETDNVDVVVDIAGLPSGIYGATITISAPGAINTPQAVPVSLNINSPPTASFTYLPSSPTTADTISFTDISTDPDGTIVSWSWSFGDGTTSTLQNPTKQYDATDTYTVILTVTDNDGATDSVSESVTVTAVNTPPPTPTLVSPPNNGGTGRSLTPTLICNVVTDADGHPVRYYFEVWRNRPLWFDERVTWGWAGADGDTSFIVGTDGNAVRLAVNTNYWWRVRAWDGMDWSDWSERWYFTTRNIPPPPPTHHSPGAGATPSIRTPTLICNAVTDADGDPIRYYFNVDYYWGWGIWWHATSGFAGPVGDTNFIVGTDGSPLVSLTWNRPHRWRIRAHDGIQFSAWSGWREFTPTNRPPSIPSHNWPAQGATGIIRTPTLICNPVTDPDGDSVRYYFDVDYYWGWGIWWHATSGFAGPVNDRHFEIPRALARNRRHRWRVRAWDGIDYSPYSGWWEFRTQ